MLQADINVYYAGKDPSRSWQGDNFTDGRSMYCWNETHFSSLQLWSMLDYSNSSKKNLFSHRFFGSGSHVAKFLATNTGFRPESNKAAWLLRLRISWSSRLRFCGRCRNSDFTITIADLTWYSSGLPPVNKLVYLAWSLWALRNSRFILH